MTFVDRNGLELSPVGHSANAYKFTAIRVNARGWSAYARGMETGKEVSIHNFSKTFKDERDAAYVAQMFALAYDKEAVTKLVQEGNFLEVTKKFVAEIELPEWKYASEGLDVEDFQSGDYGTNRVDNLRVAIVEAIKLSGRKAPSIAIAKQITDDAQRLVDYGLSMRAAAKAALTLSDW